MSHRAHSVPGESARECRPTAGNLHRKDTEGYLFVLLQAVYKALHKVLCETHCIRRSGRPYTSPERLIGPCKALLSIMMPYKVFIRS